MSKPLEELNDLDKKSSVLEHHYQTLVNQFEERAKDESTHPEELFNLIMKVLHVLMRMSSRFDKERSIQYTVELKENAKAIKNTYNNWQAHTITYISAGISIAASFAVFAPFVPGISAGLARAIQSGAQTFSGTSSGLNAIAQIFSSMNEGKRTALQTEQRLITDHQDGNKESSRHHHDKQRSVHSVLEEHMKNLHEAHRNMLG